MFKNIMLKIVLCCLVFVLTANCYAEASTEGAAYVEFIQKYRSDMEMKLVGIKGDEAKRAELEDQLLSELGKDDLNPSARTIILASLAKIGSDKSVAVLVSLLGRPESTNMAAYAMQLIGTDKARQALRSGLSELGGIQKTEIMDSLANIKDYESVGAIAEVIMSGEKERAVEAISILGCMGGKEAVDALSSDKVPADLRVNAGIALARCARQFADKGETKAGRIIYNKLYAAEQPVNIRAIGLRGLVDTKATKISSSLLESLKSDQPQMQMAAAALYARCDDKKVAGKFIDVFSDLSSDVQAILLNSMADRGDSKAIALAIDGLDSDDLDLQMSAIRAAAILGDEKAILPLAEVAVNAQRTQSFYAHKYLTMLQGKSIDSRMATLTLGGDTAVRVELMEVLADREAKSAIPTLLKATKDSDVKIAIAAFKALGKLTTPDRLGKLVEMLLDIKRSPVRISAENAVVIAAKKVIDVDQRSKAMLDAWASVKDSPNKVSLLNIMGKLSGDSTLKVIRTALNDKDMEVKSAAIRALSIWPNEGPLDDLLQIAKVSDNNVHKILALRGYIQLTGLKAHDLNLASVSIERYTTALQLATDNDTKKKIIAGLSKVRTLESFNITVGYIDEDALKAEAIASTLEIAWQIHTENPTECKPVMENILNKTDNSADLNRAQDILNRINVILENK